MSETTHQQRSIAEACLLKRLSIASKLAPGLVQRQSHQATRAKPSRVGAAESGN